MCYAKLEYSIVDHVSQHADARLSQTTLSLMQVGNRTIDPCQTALEYVEKLLRII
jgi:hypothetical protein